MPRLRHVRLAILAVPVAILLGVAPRALDGQPSVPINVEEAAAARPAPGQTLPPTVPSLGRRPGPDGGQVAAPAPLHPAALSGYVWPLPGARVTLPFEHSRWGSRIVDGELFHDGVDLATFCGDQIYAAHDGVVLAAGRRFDRYMGWQGDLEPYFARLDERRAWASLPIVIVIDDGNGYRSVYAHFSEVVVEVGQRVKAGELIGYEGRTGRATGCHLHYGLFSPLETDLFEISPAVVKQLLVPRYQTARIDPLLVLPVPVEPEPPRNGPFPAARPEVRVPIAPLQTDGP